MKKTLKMRMTVLCVILLTMIVIAPNSVYGWSGVQFDVNESYIRYFENLKSQDFRSEEDIIRSQSGTATYREVTLDWKWRESWYGHSTEPTGGISFNPSPAYFDSQWGRMTSYKDVDVWYGQPYPTIEDDGNGYYHRDWNCTLTWYGNF